MKNKPIIIILAVALVAIGIYTLKKESLDDKAERIHQSVFTIDSHADTPYQLLKKDYSLSDWHNYKKGEGLIDFPRMKEGGLDAVFFAAFTEQKECNNTNIEDARKMADRLIDSIHNAVNRSSDVAEIALTVVDGYRIEKEGKRAIYIGIENGYPIGKDLLELERYYNKGVRYITLCHSKNNDICDSSTDTNSAEYNGLSNFGEKVVAEMNRLGLIIDVSHASDSSFFDIIKVSKAPIIASHSCVRALTDHPRNISDDILKALKKNGGVIQICVLDEFLKVKNTNSIRHQKEKALAKKYNNLENLTEEESNKFYDDWVQIKINHPENVTVLDFVDHVDHVVNLVGIEHVGVGTDFDGGGGIKDCTDVSKMKLITIELLKRDYSEEDIRKIWGGNFMRVFRKVEKIASKS